MTREPLVMIPGLMADARLFLPQMVRLGADRACHVCIAAKGDTVEQMSEVNGVKVLLLILERYYMRNGSMAVSTVQIIDSGEVQQATIIGTGGGEGLMNISLGANQDFARRVAKVLAKLGFEEIRS